MYKRLLIYDLFCSDSLSERAAKSVTESLSALTVGSNPQSVIAFSIPFFGIPIFAASALTSVFLRCSKPAEISENINFSSCTFVGGGTRSSAMTLDSTFGAGKKQPGETVNSVFGFAYQFIAAVIAPYSFSPGLRKTFARLLSVS